MRPMSKAAKATDYDRVKGKLDATETLVHLMFNRGAALDVSSRSVPGWKKEFGTYKLFGYGIDRADGGVAARVWSSPDQQDQVDVFWIEGLEGLIKDLRAGLPLGSDEAVVYRITIERFLALVRKRRDGERRLAQVVSARAAGM